MEHITVQDEADEGDQLMAITATAVYALPMEMMDEEALAGVMKSEFPATPRAWWESTETNYVMVARLEDGRPVIMRHFYARVEMFEGNFASIIGNMRAMAEAVKFVEDDGVAVSTDGSLDPEDEVRFTIDGWAETSEEVYETALRYEAIAEAAWEARRQGSA